MHGTRFSLIVPCTLKSVSHPMLMHIATATRAEKVAIDNQKRWYIFALAFLSVRFAESKIVQNARSLEDSPHTHSEIAPKEAPCFS